jgi:putative colanic acid biosynthesis UDP-glucose lipid carrier transferase
MNKDHEYPMLSLARRLVDPLIIFLGLLISVMVQGKNFDGLHLLLGVLAALVASKVFARFDFFDIPDPHNPGGMFHFRNLIFGWLIVLAILGIVGGLSGLIHVYDPDVLLVWSVITPIFLCGAHAWVRSYLEVLRGQGNIRHAIIVGANDLGHKLASKIHQQRSLMMRVEGFFDDRFDERCDDQLKQVVFGGIDDVAAFVTGHNIDVVYITLPMLDHARVVDLVNSLRDTTASIYFVPDVFMFDLVQTHIDNVNGVPVISVFETPLTGINAINKRAFDILASSLILLLISPVLIAIALMIKVSSPGPVIFKQRRYGIDGEPFLVYKFRSMSVCEDAEVVTQATQNDARVTHLGAILRKTSLDELPQLFNVLNGSMSIVGPRPHAIAHNEHYRKIIRGYMWRHKVKPGITGWAQINGYRGETDTLDKMEGRVIYDISYLKNWSLWLDLTIILKTVKLIVKDSHAY